MPEDTNNRLCKLITDNLQLMLINVLIRYILSSKPVQGSVAARLSWDGIINYYYHVLHSHCWVWRWQNFEHRSIFG